MERRNMKVVKPYGINYSVFFDQDKIPTLFKKSTTERVVLCPVFLKILSIFLFTTDGDIPI